MGDTGLINQAACCAASCGQCGGSGCSDFPGGYAACCRGSVIDLQPSCEDNLPPCVIGAPAAPAQPQCDSGLTCEDDFCITPVCTVMPIGSADSFQLSETYTGS